MTEQEQQVIDEVNFCIDSLAKAAKVTIKERPEIKVGGMDTSGYDRNEKILYIHEDNIGEGITYFEEAAHFLREEQVPAKGFSEDHRAHEFFGRLGEAAGRQLVQNTEYKHLFNGSEPRKFSDMGFFEEQIKVSLKHEKEMVEVDEQYKIIAKRSLAFNDVHKSIHSNLSTLLEGYKTSSNPAQLLSDSKKYLDEYIANLNGFKPSEIFKDVISLSDKIQENVYSYFGNVIKINSYADALKEEINDKEKSEKLKRFFQFEAERDLIKIGKSIMEIHALIKHKQIDIHFAGFQIESRYNGFMDHFEGYVAAEAYVQDNPGFMKHLPKLFKKPDESILKNFITDEILAPYRERESQLRAEIGL